MLTTDNRNQVNKPRYALPKALRGYLMSFASTAQYGETYDAYVPTQIKVTVYPTGKRRRRLDAAPSASKHVLVNGPRPNQGALVASTRHKVDAGMGETLRQVNWDGFGTGAVTRYGTDQAITHERDRDLMETAPWVEPEDHTYRWDHSLKAYAHAAHWPGNPNPEERASKRVTIPREYRKPRKGGLRFADSVSSYITHGVQPGKQWHPAHVWPTPKADARGSLGQLRSHASEGYSTYQRWLEAGPGNTLRSQDAPMPKPTEAKPISHDDVCMIRAMVRAGLASYL